MFKLPLAAGKARDALAKMAALDRSQAMIEFALDGTVLTANARFLAVMGYTLPEIEGRQHSLFVSAAYGASPEYKAFWDALRRGEFQAAEFMRLGKGGKVVWLQASYNPIIDSAGRPYKVLKVAVDTTAAKMQMADYEGQMKAVNKSQAVIEFDLNGTVTTANANFLNALGYTLEEIRGRHHSMFVDSSFRDSTEYQEFWQRLRRGEYLAAEYKRIGKNGREVWIQGSYNPIFGPDGGVVKVVKYATDVTRQVQDRMRRASIAREVDSGLDGIAHGIATATEQAAGAASASAQTSANVQAVAAGAEQLVSSVSEISRQISEASRVSAKAVEEAGKTGSIVTELSEAAKRIGDVVRLIADIASQTNLLALNATIESARAGDAGKGFAVVAGEVKTLAAQTGKATEDISRQISQVQDATTNAVGAISTIGATIGQIAEIAAAIAGATEEQNAVARDISANMQAAADAVTSISHNMEQIAEATKAAESSARQVKSASETLAA